MKRIISFACVLIFSLFLSFSNCLAAEIGSEFNNNFSNEPKPNNIKNKDNYTTDASKTPNEEIFGDEQAFPFVAGLGKNAAH